MVNPSPCPSVGTSVVRGEVGRIVNTDPLLSLVIVILVHSLLCFTWNPHLRNGISFFFFFRAASVLYGSSQAEGQVRATAAGLCHSHSNARSLARVGQWELLKCEGSIEKAWAKYYLKQDNESFLYGAAETNLTRNNEVEVWSLASLLGSRIWHCCVLWCRSKMQLGSGIAVAVA